MAYFGGNYFGANYYGPNYYGEVGTAPATSPLRPAIAAMLAGNSTVASLTSGRVYFGSAPQAVAYPWLVYWISDRSYGYTLGGADGTSLATVQIQIAAYTEAVSDQLAIAIRGLLGDLAPGVYQGCYILRSLISHEADVLIAPKGGSGQWISVIDLAFDVMHRV